MVMLERIRAAISAFRAADGGSAQPTDQVGHAYTFYRSVIDEWAEEAYDDLVARKGVGIYREMMKRDDAVHSSVRLPIIARVSKLPEFQPRSDSLEDRLSAWLCAEAFDRLERGSMTRFLADTMSGIAMGFSATEKVWGKPTQVEVPEDVTSDPFEVDVEDSDDDEVLPIRESVTRRMVQLPRRFHLLPAETLTFKLDHFGEIESDGVWQLSGRYITPTTLSNPGMYTKLDRSRFVLWKWFDEEGWDNPFGLSILRPAYRWYFLKDMIVRWAGEYLERFGKPATKITTSEVLSPAKARQIDTLLQSFQTSNRYRLSEGDIKSLELVELQHTTTDTYEQWLKVCNRAIARCGLTPSLVMEGGESVGSNALGQTHRDTFDVVIDHLGVLLADEVLREQVCADIVHVNIGPDARPPIVKFPPIAERDRTRIIGEVKLAQEAGYVIPRQWAYEEAGVPIPGDGEEILDEPKRPMPEVGLGDRDVAEARDPRVRDLVRDVADADGGRDKDDVMAALQGMGKRSRYAHRDWYR